jgi:hypothetical protein
MTIKYNEVYEGAGNKCISNVCNDTVYNVQSLITYV